MKKRNLSASPPTSFNEGEFLKDFDEIDQALNESLHDLNERDSLSPEDPDSFINALSPEAVPFPSSIEGKKKKPPHLPLTDSSEDIIYREARRGMKSRQGRRGIWRFLPHVGHRRRHWIQRHFTGLLAGFLLIAVLGTFFFIQVLPQFNLGALDESVAASRAHAAQDYDSAIRLYQDYLKIHPDNSLKTIEIHYYLGACYESIGSLDKAKGEYLKVWQFCRRQMENSNGADRITDQIQEFAPLVYPHSIYSLGRIAIQQEEQALAKSYFEQLLDLFPDYCFAPEVKQQLSQWALSESQTESSTDEEASLQTEGQNYEKE